MLSEWINFIKGNSLKFIAPKDHKEDLNYLGVKTPIEALNKNDKVYAIERIGVSIATATPTTILAIKNTSTEDMVIRLATFNITVTSNQPTAFRIKVVPSNEVTGTFNNYDVNSNSQYSTTNTLVPIALQGLNFFGTVILGNTQSRINLFKDDVIIRCNPNETIVINAECSQGATISYFIRHIEEY